MQAKVYRQYSRMKPVSAKKVKIEEREQRFIDTMTSFINYMFRGIENLKFGDKLIGTSIFLVNFIGRNQQCNMGEVREYLDINASTATRRVDRLVKLGLVKRTSTEDDRRSVLLELSEEGKKLYAEFLRGRMSNIKKMIQESSEAEVETFFKVMDKVMGIHGMKLEI